MRIRSISRLVAVVAAAAAVGALALTGPAQAAGDQPGKYITRAEVIARAENWFARNVPYSQSATATDPDGAHTYRTDCSGFVSMAWHLAKTGLGSPTTVSLPEYATKISKANLKPGDILDDPGHHTVLFAGWADSAHTRFTYYSEGSTATDMNHDTASLSSYSGYDAYRYNKIMDATAGTAGTLAAGDHCATTPARTISLKGVRNLDITTVTCIRDDAGTLHGWLVLSWKPSTGSDDSQTIGTAKFDGFSTHVQIQHVDRTVVEGGCSAKAAVNAAASGSVSCEVTYRASSTAGLTTDGWLDWNKNNDGKSWLGAVYVHGSPEL
ncbi:hypothetical protein [Fodinicola acaciae]|uniref:hypothetical protein n=1 Tax=Fodinicola acaciae TaxID=2681555 RepID=UPI0013D7FF97|nr:hypothetical protein [Fodinicola acaciae]